MSKRYPLSKRDATKTESTSSVKEGMIVIDKKGNEFVIKCWDKKGVFMRQLKRGIEKLGDEITEYNWEEVIELFL